MTFLSFYREYGAIDDVDIDLHIDVSFLDVSTSNMNSHFTLNLYWHSYTTEKLLNIISTIVKFILYG